MYLGRRALLSAVLTVILLVTLVPSAQAAELILSTRYPGVTVKAGQKVTLTLEITKRGLPSGPVELAVTRLPEGWPAPTFRGGGFEVSRVFVAANESESVTMDLEIPAGTPSGTYQVVLAARSPQGQSTLPVVLTVSETGSAGARLTTQYPALEGPVDATYQFRVTLHNESNQQQLFSLSAQAPQGWEVIFRPAYESKRVASIPVEGNSSQTLDVEVQPAKDTPAGEYTVQVAAAAGNVSATTDLKIKILGSYELEVTTPTGRLSANATAGAPSPVTLEVKNTGTAPLKGITLSAVAPPNWSVEFKPGDTIEALNPGDSRQVEAVIKPDGKAIAGDYMVTISARTREASNSAQFRVSVRTRTTWGLVGLLLIALVGGGVAWVFRTYGRR